MPTVHLSTGWSGESDRDFLENVSSQTPGTRGEWENVRAVDHPAEADYHVGFNHPRPFHDPSRLLLFCSEPPVLDECGDLDRTEALAVFPIEEFYKPQRWWVKKSYDELQNADRPTKTKDLSWITSDKGRDLHPLLGRLRCLVGATDREGRVLDWMPGLGRDPTDGHVLRMRFLDRLVERHPNLLHLYGRGDFSGPHYRGTVEDKWTGLEPYRYSLAIENYSGPNYFSEKIVDPLLAWCMPIYWGCTNLDEFLPEESYVEIDITSDDVADRVAEIVASNRREQHLDAIAEARRRIMEEYQLWPTVADAVRAV